MITTPKVLHNALVPMSRVLTRNLLPGVKWIDDLPRIMPLVPKAARPFNNDPVRPVEPPYDIENIPGISPPSESNPPSRWPSFEQISDDVLASVDEALKKGDYDFAVRKLELLLANHGPQPELTLRMGLAELGRGKVADAAARFNMTSLRRLQDPAAFFDEINVRILSDVSPVERENYHHVAAFYDWLDHEAHTGQALGRPMISAYDEQLQLEYRLATRPRGDPLTRETLAAIDPASEVVYVDDQLANIYGADAPGPANMDWYAVVDAVLLELAEGELPPLVVLHDVGLAHFRPAAIYLGEGVEGDIVARRYTPCITLEQPARNFGSNEGDNEGDIVARSSPPVLP